MLHLLAPALTGKAAIVHMPASPFLGKTPRVRGGAGGVPTWALVAGAVALVLLASGPGGFEVRNVGPNAWETYYYDGQGLRQTLHFTMAGRPSAADVQNALGQMGIVGARPAPAP